ncbi:MAG: twin-arginine translocation signal domain-containing protein [Kiritimatiellae bacterium]|nr:twin-arginine translocation signal domain-containing protein [Kiritimatiellia bacterium]
MKAQASRRGFLKGVIAVGACSRIDTAYKEGATFWRVRLGKNYDII